MRLEGHGLISKVTRGDCGTHRTPSGIALEMKRFFAATSAGGVEHDVFVVNLLVADDELDILVGVVVDIGRKSIGCDGHFVGEEGFGNGTRNIESEIHTLALCFLVGGSCTVGKGGVELVGLFEYYRDGTLDDGAIGGSFVVGDDHEGVARRTGGGKGDASFGSYLQFSRGAVEGDRLNEGVVGESTVHRLAIVVDIDLVELVGVAAYRLVGYLCGVGLWLRDDDF